MKTKAADFIIDNALIYTSDEKNKWAQALAVNDGVLTFVGSSEEASKYRSEDTVYYDMNGKMILPGLIDAHTHIGLSVMMGGEDDTPMYDCKSKQEVLDKLKKYVRSHPFKMFYMMYFGQAEALGEEGLNYKEIDAIVKHRPVILMENESHSGWLNSGALKAFKMTKNTPDPSPGYSYHEKDENGELTGCVKEMALLPMLELSGNVSKKEMHDGIAKLVDYLVSHGVTAIYDAGNFIKEDEFYTILADMDRKGEIPIRVEGTHIINLPQKLDNAIEEFKRLKATYTTEHIKFKTMKMMLDGTQRIHTAKMIEPYADCDSTGGTLIPEDKLYQFILDLNAEKIDFHLHTVGEGAIRMVLDCVEKAVKELGKPLDIIITCAHVEVLHPDDVKRFKELNVTADFTPSWHGGACASDIDGMIKLLGEKRAYNTLQARSVVDTGARVTFSSDEVSLHELECWSPFYGMETGHTRQDIAKGGKDAPVFPSEDESLSLESLVKGYTIAVAEALRLDDKIGSIKAGKDANLIVLDKNLFEVDKYEIHNIVPEKVMIGGKWVR